MNVDPNQRPEQDRKQYWLNLTLAGMTAQVGCVTLILALAAVFGGLWLDNYFQTRPVITIVLLLVSVPISLVIMFFIAKQATARIKAGGKNNPSVMKEEAGLDRKDK